ncbi:hypothetical protein CkaCkLH20_06915 [Colletotrichum karsti]|uniref:Uncharacterized protein n=1 Tax=Colletotrichum karsti TaxID=1095194 RepID=A0A9P6LGS5_9PEZI|nr:uncharacterized protein CkaCkLH20_06915 [Colletotrichum karsti]KAF9875534.1 hypothetical protein CkaCkLH20_06915 [Colletotrichum karsti]
MGGAWRDFPAVQGPLPIYSDANDIYTEQYLNMEQELQRKDKELQWALRCHEKERNSYQGRIEGLERALRAEERQGRQLERRPKLKRDRALAEQKSRITTLEAQNSKYKGEISRIIQAEKSLQRDYDHKANENGILDRRLQKALHEAGLRNEEIQNLRSILQSTQVDLERTRKHVQDVQRDIQQVKLAYDQEIRLGTQRQEEHSDKIKALEKRHLEDTSTSAIQHAAEMEILKEENTKQLSQAKTDHDERTKDLSNKLALKELRIAAFSSSGNYKPIHDNGFGQALQRLSQQVKNLTAYVPTTNLIPVDSNIDPTKYLVRNPNSSRGWQNFVRSVCWKIIIRGFFAYQLGFGSLGSHGEGFQSLLMFYQLFARSGRNNANSKSLVFPTNKETNFGRAWFFDGILQSVRSNASGDGFASMFQKNVSYVAIELANALQRLNNGSLVPQAEMQIQNLMREFGELALQMGSQRAQVFLEVCGHGDVISAGERFTEEAEAKGMVEVDLMIQPGLVRIGDGREDLSSEAVIAKGSIVSLKGVSNQ